MEEYEILGIYREIVQRGVYDFKMILFDGKDIVVKKASDRMKDVMRRGRFYKEDWICIRDEDNGIVFELIDPRPYTYASMRGEEFNYEVHSTIRRSDRVEDGSPGKRHRLSSETRSLEVGDVPVFGDGDSTSGKVLLPFLNDTPPYGFLRLPRLAGRPVYSENGTPSGRYIVDTCEYITVDEWYSRGCPSAPVIGRVGYKTRMASVSCNRKCPYYFFVLLTSPDCFLKVVVWGEDLPYSSMSVGDVIGLEVYRRRNPVDRTRVVEYNRFSEAAYFTCREVSAKEMFEIQLEKTGEMPESIFDSVSGEVEYLSVLHRRHSVYLDEYYLARVGGHRVLVFYNSSASFYKIEVGRILRITNLRTVERGGFEFYISTIYTQIEFLREEACSSHCSVEAAGTDDAINFEVVSGGSGEIGARHAGLVFGAIGYVPDDFPTVEEVFEKRKTKIGRRWYDVGPFMVPEQRSVRDICADVEKMVLNESRKYFVEAVLVDVDFSNFVCDETPTLRDGTAVEYVRDGATAQQVPGYIKISDGAELVVCLFKNFWIGGHEEMALYRLGGCSSLEELKRMRGRRMGFIVNAFRVSEDTVLFYLSRTFDVDVD